MTDDEILNALGLAAKAEAESDPHDARWDALAAGALDDADRAELEALAAADPALADALAAFAPRDAALDARIAAAVTAAVTEADEASEAEPADAVADDRSDESLADVVSIANWRRRALFVGLPLLAAAAAIVLLARPAPSLPTYALEALSGEKIARGDEPARSLYRPGATIDLVLRPAQAVAAPIGVAAFDRQGDEVVRLAVQPTVNEQGVARLSGPVDQVLPGTPGEHVLVFVIGPPDELPRAPAGLARDRASWQVLEHRYRYVTR